MDDRMHEIILTARDVRTLGESLGTMDAVAVRLTPAQASRFADALLRRDRSDDLYKGWDKV